MNGTVSRPKKNIPRRFPFVSEFAFTGVAPAGVPAGALGALDAHPIRRAASRSAATRSPSARVGIDRVVRFVNNFWRVSS